MGAAKALRAPLPPKATAHEGDAVDSYNGTGHLKASHRRRQHSKQNPLHRIWWRTPDRPGKKEENYQGRSFPAYPPHIWCSWTPLPLQRKKTLNQVLTVSSPSYLIRLNPITTALTPDLVKIATRLTARVAQIGFFPVRAEARGLLELQQIHLDSHRAAALLNHARQHGLRISLPQGMPEEEPCAALH